MANPERLCQELILKSPKNCHTEECQRQSTPGRGKSVSKDIIQENTMARNRHREQETGREQGSYDWSGGAQLELSGSAGSLGFF